MTSASLPPVSLTISLTQSSMVPMLPAWTPQSIRMWAGPVLVGTVTRKKSPKPILYIRTRRPPFALPAAPAPPPARFEARLPTAGFAVLRAGLAPADFAVFLVDLAAVLRLGARPELAVRVVRVAFFAAFFA